MPVAARVAQVLEIIEIARLVPVIRLDDLGQAVELAGALLEGGITALEFTLTNPGALHALQTVKAALPHFAAQQAVIGAGSVLNVGQAHSAIEAGAQFVVSPVTNLATIEFCKKSQVAVMPGALTPTEILSAWEAGANLVKLFPARAFGPAYLKDLREPLPFLKLMPTGGINLENAAAYIRSGAVAIGVGGNLVDKQLVAAGDFEALRFRAAAYVRAVQGAKDHDS